MYKDILVLTGLSSHTIRVKLQNKFTIRNIKEMPTFVQSSEQIKMFQTRLSRCFITIFLLS